MYNRTNDCKGITLIELMLSLSISVIILIILSNTYLMAHSNFILQAGLNSIEENAELALRILENDITLAGYMGCARLSATLPLMNHTDYIIANLYGTSKSLTISHASPERNQLLQDMKDDMTLFISNDYLYQPGEVLVIGNCDGIEIFKIKTVELYPSHYQKVVSANPLSHHYKKLTDISNLIINTYFVKTTNRKTPAGKSISALYVENIKKRTTELIEGIEQVQFIYDTTGVGIKLLVASTNQIALNKIWYGYAPIQ